MRNSQKIAAFTINEILIVLVITSIVVGISFAVLQLVTKQIKAIEKKYETSNAIVKLKYQLLVDFDKSVNISGKDNELRLSIDGETALYEFSKQGVYKVDDTLQVAINRLQFYLKGEEVEEGTIDGVKIYSTALKNDGYIFVSKKSSSKEEMRLWDYE